MTPDPNDLFSARTASFRDTMMRNDAHIGYRIPEYQRPFNWGEKHIKRLLKDCLDSFHRFCHTPTGSPGSTYAYLGSIITADHDAEPTFSGHSADLIDGQQRLTTLVLMSCCIDILIQEYTRPLATTSSSNADRVQREVAHQRAMLKDCAIGMLQTSTGSVPYPKLVRSEDIRARTANAALYRSPIAAFIDRLRASVEAGAATASLGDVIASIPDPQLQPSFRVIAEVLCGSLCRTSDDRRDPDNENGSLPAAGEVRIVGSAVTLLQYGADTSEAFVALASECDNYDLESLHRLLLFASYLANHVLVTSIHTPGEEDALAIFDALNTTGEPLTALETCKPLVTDFEKRKGPGFRDSDSNARWRAMEEALSAGFRKQEELATFVQKAVISFGLYLDGTQLGRDLAEQRRYLRNRFRTAEENSDEAARRFVAALGDIVRFHLYCWSKTDISKVNVSGWSESEIDNLKLALSFVKDMNTTLAIPILARYWVAYGGGQDSRQFLEAAKAVAAFLVIRTAVNGGTKGIDDSFRSVMKTRFGVAQVRWSAGTALDDEVPSAAELRRRLRAMLNDGGIEVSDRESWIQRVSRHDLGRTTHKAVCRLIVLAAVDQAVPDGALPALWSREDRVQRRERSLFSYSTWVGPRYRTVEHVAPDGKQTQGWDEEIYRDPTTRNLIGNLVLLPERCNAAIADAPWTTKELFYRALASSSVSDREEAIREAGMVGRMFGPTTEKIIRSEESLHLLEGLANVDDWTAKIVEDRTVNFLELAWERISPWLF